MESKKLVEKIKVYRESLYLRSKSLLEEPDKRYPTSFNEGLYVSTIHAMHAIDDIIEFCEDEPNEK